SYDRVGHAASGFAYGFGDLRQKAPVKSADAAIDEITEDDNERRNYKNGCASHSNGSRAVCHAPGEAHLPRVSFVTAMIIVIQWPSLAYRGLHSTPEAGRER